jgi:hypothetical protein
MGGASLLVAVIALGIGLLVSLLLFGAGPAPIRSVFFRPSGSWRRFGRSGLLCAVAALVLMGLFVTLRHAA